MVNLFDIVRQAQNGAAMDNFARQFGLSLDQTQRAMEALLPAFSLGFQRSARNPALFAQLLEMMASGRYAPFFDGTAGPAQPNGQQVLEKLFGSSEVTRQIAAQSSAMTGIASHVLQQMLPAMAPVLMGGLSRYATLEGLSDFLRSWSDWLRMLAPEAPPPRPALGTPYGAWVDLMGSLMGGRPGAGPAPAPQAAPADPWTSFMQGYLKAMPQAASAPPPPPPPPSQPNPFEVLSQMFETGRDVQAQHLAGLQGILDAFWTAQPDGTRPGQA